MNEDRLRRLIQVGRDLVSELDVETLLQRIVEVARELTDARYAALGILNEERSELERFITAGIDEQTRARIGDLPRGHGVLGVLIDDPKPLRLVEVGQHPKSYGFPSGHPPMRSFLGVPITIRGQAWGDLYLTDKSDGEFTPGDEEAAVTLAGWAATAIENARLYQQVESRRAQMERAQRISTITAEIARAVGAETELDLVLELIVKRGRSVLEAESMLVLVPEGEELVVAATAGVADRSVRGLRLPLTGSAAQSVLVSGELKRVDVHEATENAGARAGIDLTTGQLTQSESSDCVLVPMIFRSQTLGVLLMVGASSHGGRPPTEQHDLLLTFAATAATAVATARSVAAHSLRRSLEASESERARWARELHDETLQELAGLSVLMSTVDRTSDSAQRVEAMAGARAQLGETIRNLRHLISDLRPAALDELGIDPAVEALVERIASGSGLEITVQSDFDFESGRQATRIEPQFELTIYRLVQEALTNVIKHAQAEHAKVELREVNGVIELTVSDDGIGFDPFVTTEGFGLLGMRERAAIANGSFEVQSGSTGTSVHARISAPHRLP